jgi:hypothetical protein
MMMFELALQATEAPTEFGRFSTEKCSSLEPQTVLVELEM